MNFFVKLLLERRWFLLVGVCFLGIFLLRDQFAPFGNPEILSSLDSVKFSPLTIILIIAISTFISEDLTCLTAGTLVSQGKIDFGLAVFACAFGIFAGDIALFWIGRIFGRNALKIEFISRIVSEQALDRSSALLEKYGMFAVLISRFTPGLRLPLYLFAGILKTNFLKFTAFFSAAAILWTPIIVGAPAYFGDEIANSVFFRNNFWLGFAATVVVFFVICRLAFKLASRKERRILLGKLKRIYKWEFWSLKFFYFPVAIYIVWLMIKYRSATVFTAVNPAIFASGFVGESKTAILNALCSEFSKPFLLRFASIANDNTLEDKVSLAKTFLHENELEFPVVLKPDAGERGKGVSIVRSFEELESAVGGSECDLIIQEYAGGEEVSVFYYRFPNSEIGNIFSITEKRFPFVIGDGEANLEDLILDDKRAICLAESYFKQNSDDLLSVPEKGEKVQIIDIGTHSRGAIFLDGEWMKSEKLVATIDGICRGFKGFYFGRFDIRVRSFKEFKLGRDFKIIELNGVTSESTNIYDPKFTLAGAYGVLFRQWQIAFAIGAENVKRGFRPVSLRTIFRLASAHLTGKNTSENQFNEPIALKANL